MKKLKDTAMYFSCASVMKSICRAIFLSSLSISVLFFTSCANKEATRANFYNELQSTETSTDAGLIDMEDEQLPAGNPTELCIFSSVTVVPFLSSLAEEYKQHSGNVLDFVGVGKNSSIEGVLSGECSAAVFASDGSERYDEYEMNDAGGEPGAGGGANADGEPSAGGGGHLIPLAIAYEGVRLISNKDSGIKNITYRELVDLFTGEASELGSKEVTLVVPKIGLPIRDIFEEIFPVSGSVDGRWRTLIPDSALVGASEDEVIALVESAPDSIGIISLCNDASNVNTVSIDDSDPSSIDSYIAKREIMLFFNDDANIASGNSIGYLIELLSSGELENVFVNNGLVPLL